MLKLLGGTLSTYSLEESSTPESERLLHQPSRTSIVTKDNDTTLFMPSSDSKNTGMKVVALPAKGGAIGVINVFSIHGALLGLVAATEVTAFRTALTIMSLFTLSPDQIPRKHIVIFGSGKQVVWHIRLALLLSPPGQIETITVFNRGRARLNKLKEEVSEFESQVSFKFIAKDDHTADDYNSIMKDELHKSDSIFCCTPSTEPLFPDSYLSQKRRFISLIGSYKPHMKEVDSQTILSGDSTIFVDAKRASLEESGEFRDAQVTPDQLIEVGELLNNPDSVDLSKYPNIIFKCVGLGIMDLVIGRALIDISTESGLGTSVEW